MIKRIEREPIKLGSYTIALLQIFTNTVAFEDLGLLSETPDMPDYKAIAKQLVSQFKGHLSLALSVAFAEAFRKDAEDHILHYPGSGPYEEVIEFIEKLDRTNPEWIAWQAEWEANQS